jgi:hypothetical protein
MSTFTRVHAKSCYTPKHAGCPYVFDVPHIITFGQICDMILQRNNQWFGLGRDEYKYSKVQLLKSTNDGTLLDENLTVANPQNEITVVFQPS